MTHFGENRCREFFLRLRPWYCLLLLLPLGAALAHEDGRAPAAHERNAQAGARLAAQGNPDAGIPACSTCHGQRGQGSQTAGIPRLAGQGADYLEHQLKAFVNGERPSPAMTPISRKLNPQQRRDLGAYFAGAQASALPPTGEVDDRLLRRGEQLSMNGDPGLGVPACSACHGWNGAGNPPEVPYLAGQHASYLLSQLENWRNGSRNSDHQRQMPQIARRLKEGDLEALAQYFARLPAPHSLGASEVPHGKADEHRSMAVEHKGS